MANKVTRSFCLDPADLELIQTEAARKGISTSALLTLIIRDWADKEAK